MGKPRVTHSPGSAPQQPAKPSSPASQTPTAQQASVPRKKRKTTQIIAESLFCKQCCIPIVGGTVYMCEGNEFHSPMCATRWAYEHGFEVGSTK